MSYRSPPLPFVRFEPFASVLPMPPVLPFRLRAELDHGLFSCHLCLALGLIQLDSHRRKSLRVLLNDLRELLNVAVVHNRPFRTFLPVDVGQFVEIVDKYGKEYPRYTILR